MRATGYVMAGIASLALAGLATADTMDKVRGAAAGTAGMHEVRGVVKNLDRDQNQVTIDSQGREMELQLPATALRDLQEGDNVIVTLGIRESTAGAGTGSGTQHGDAPSTAPKTGAGASPGSSSRGIPDSPTGDR